MNKTSIPMAIPDLTGNEKKYLNECIDSGWISSAGPFVTRFSEAFASYVGASYGLAVSSGTAALHLSLLGLGIGQGDEVIVPDLTFVASANAVVSCGAKPVFVDVDPRTWNMDPSKIKEAISSRTKAIMCVHLYGNPADMESIMSIASHHKIKVIEDAAEAHGATFRMNSASGSMQVKRVGSIGDVGCFSFYGNKIITTGEGGMVVTSDKEVFHRMNVLRDHGQSPGTHYVHHVIGYNYRMTNMQAAIGLAQLERIDESIKKKREIAAWYKEGLKEHAAFSFQEQTEGGMHVCWMPTCLVRVHGDVSANTIALALQSENIESRPVFTPMHQLDPYREPESFPVSEDIFMRGISLPSYQSLRREDVMRIVSCMVNAYYEKIH